MDEHVSTDNLRYSVEPASTATLVRSVLDEASNLFRAEIALAREEMRREAKSVVAAGIAFGAAVVAGALGSLLLVIAFAMAIFPHPLAALVVGVALLIGAGVAIAVGLKALPSRPMGETRVRLETDAQLIKEQLA